MLILRTVFINLEVISLTDYSPCVRVLCLNKDPLARDGLLGGVAKGSGMAKFASNGMHGEAITTA
jgi:hypothetical protein